MNLFTRFSLIAVVMFAGIVGAVGYSYRQSRQKIDELVIDQVREHTTFFRNATVLLGTGLKNVVAGNSWWDDMVEFVHSANPQWATENIDNLVGTPNGADALWVCDANLGLVHALDADYRRPRLPFAQVESVRALIGDSFEFNYYTVINGEIWQIFGAAIQDPKFWRHETPVVGYFLIGKKWDETWNARLGALCQSRLQINLIATDDSPAAATMPTEYQFVSPILGFDGKPIATVIGTFDATIVEQVRRSFGEHALVFALSVALLLTLIGLFVGITIVRPLGRITRSLESRNPMHLADLLVAKSDFGEIARLLSSQFRQGRMLQEEIRRRLASIDPDDESRRRESNEALRLRLASDLHDGPLQSIYAAGLKISSLEASSVAGRSASAPQLAAIRQILTECSANLRNLLLDLEPEELRDQDLDQSLQRFERYLQSISEQTSQLSIEDGVLDGITRDAQLHVYYIARELISNAARHAHPDHTSLILRREGGFLVLRWENDGFEPTENFKTGNGLRNIGQRVIQLDGTWSHRIHRGRTWQVTIEIPFTALAGDLPLTSPRRPSSLL